MSAPMELQLQAALIHPAWVLRTKYGSSARTVHTHPLALLASLPSDCLRHLYSCFASCAQKAC